MCFDLMFGVFEMESISITLLGGGCGDLFALAAAERKSFFSQ